MRSSKSIGNILAFLFVAVSIHGQNRVILSDSRANHPAAAMPAPNVPLHTELQVVHAAVLPSGMPLRVQVAHRYRLHRGMPVQGFLIDPVYSIDHVVLPAYTPVYGTVTNMVPVSRSTLVWARLNGDFTPLKKPVIHFSSLQLPNGSRLTIDANAAERTADLVKMGPPAKKQSRFAKMKAAAHQKILSVKNGFSGAIHSHHKSDKALQILYGQLPYHPQEIWAGTQFDADLAQPLTLTSSKGIQLFPVTPPPWTHPAGNARCAAGHGAQFEDGQSGQASGSGPDTALHVG